MEILPRFKIQYPMKNRCKYILLLPWLKATVGKHTYIVCEWRFSVDKQKLG